MDKCELDEHWDTCVKIWKHGSPFMLGFTTAELQFHMKIKSGNPFRIGTEEFRGYEEAFSIFALPQNG